MAYYEPDINERISVYDLRNSCKDIEYFDVAFEKGKRLAREFQEWRPDCVQECYAAILKARPETKQDASTIANRQAIDFYRWLKHWKKHNGQEIVSLSEKVNDGDNGDREIELGDLIEDKHDRIEEYLEILDAKILLSKIPSEIIKIGMKRVQGKALSSRERVRLMRWRQKDGKELAKML